MALKSCKIFVLVRFLSPYLFSTSINFLLLVELRFIERKLFSKWFYLEAHSTGFFSAMLTNEALSLWTMIDRLNTSASLYRIALCITPDTSQESVLTQILALDILVLTVVIWSYGNSSTEVIEAKKYAPHMLCVRCSSYRQMGKNETFHSSWHQGQYGTAEAEKDNQRETIIIKDTNEGRGGKTSLWQYHALQIHVCKPEAT